MTLFPAFARPPRRMALPTSCCMRDNRRYCASKGRLNVIDSACPTASDLEALWVQCGADPEASDFDASYTAPDGTRFRVNLLRQLGRRGAVMRRIRSEIPSLEALGVPAEILREWMGRSHGILIVSGRTGSGKSTTLAACLEEINAGEAKHIVTVEDPIEMVFTPRQSVFTQREVGIDTASFAEGLRRAMRQSPDIILVGEIRDAETAETALHAAETGHLVLATLHAATTSEAVERFQNLFPENTRPGFLKIFSQSLIGILCQKLVAATDGGLALATEFFSNEGLGPKLVAEGRLAELSDWVERGDSQRSASFLRSLVALCKAGRISEESGTEAASNVAEFQRALRGIQTGGNAGRR